MGLSLNVALVLVAFLYAATAFGGEIWEKGTRPLYQRITNRGWICISLLCVTLALGTTREIRSHNSEATLQGERDAAKAQLIDVQTQAQSANAGIKTTQETLAKTQTSLNEAQGRLQDAQGRLQDAQGRLINLQGQAQESNKQLLKANQSLSENRTVVGGIADLTRSINNVGIMTALSREQKTFPMEVRIPVADVTLDGAAPATHVVDFLFPKWSKLAVTDDEQLMIYLRVETAGGDLIGNLWGFKKDPYEIKTIGMAVRNPDGTETSLKMFGTAFVKPFGKKMLLASEFTFPNSQVPAAWLAKLRPNTKIFEAGFHLRHDLSTVQFSNLQHFWDTMFQKNGTVRIQLLDQDSFFLEYDIQRQAVALKDDWVRVSYSISSRPRLITENL
ncbi:MAG: hypothetical protein QOH41_220 [Blastocatellia bacterium]|jgi:hypothetical protein|nr:hypothetical protein [Blastocatellia bacterium]